MANPFTTARVSGDNIILNGVNIDTEATSVLEAAKHDDYLNMGRNIA
jgi:hypothetical protein